jgi:hypothetical protein
MCGSASHPQGLAGRHLSNTFVGEEIERAALALNLERIGGSSALIIDWLDAAPLDAVPLDQLADRIVALLRARREDPQALITWRERNLRALREFWARAPADALGVKQEFGGRWPRTPNQRNNAATPQPARSASNSSFEMVTPECKAL